MYRFNISWRVQRLKEIRQMDKRNWYVCDNNGYLAGHDLDKAHAKELEAKMQEQEPNKGWEALEI